MTGEDVIEEIKKLPALEQQKVFEFAKNQPAGRQLSPGEIGELVNRMVEAKDPAEADRLREEIVKGFYGRR